VEEAWRIVDPVLKDSTPIHEYDKGAWGPMRSTKEFHPPEGGITPPPRTRKTSRSRPSSLTKRVLQDDCDGFCVSDEWMSR